MSDEGVVSKDKLLVTIRSRQGLAYEGELASISSYNQVGAFDILPQHINFVSMITKKVILRRADGKIDEINVDKGVLIVESNKVRVFIGVGTL